MGGYRKRRKDRKTEGWESQAGTAGGGRELACSVCWRVGAGAGLGLALPVELGIVGDERHMYT